MKAMPGFYFQISNPGPSHSEFLPQNFFTIAAMWILNLTDTRCRFLCHGPDALRYLNGQLTQDVRLVRIGEAKPTCLTNAKGRLEAELVIAELPLATQAAMLNEATSPGYLLDAPIELRDFLALRLEKYLIADDCVIVDVTDNSSQFHVPGQVVMPTGLPEESAIHSSERFGQSGTDMLVPRHLSTDLQRALEATPLAARLADDAWVQQFRDDCIRRAVPIWGAELDANTLPPEAGLEKSHISYHKGCYIGQEVISRLKSVGQVVRRLCLLQRESSENPPQVRLQAGDTVFAEPPENDGARPCGSLTSVSSDGVWALGYVKRPHHIPGSCLYILPNSQSALSIRAWVLDAPQPPTD